MDIIFIADLPIYFPFFFKAWIRPGFFIITKAPVETGAFSYHISDSNLK